ncbi:MAG: hypothetical protein OXG13_15525 [Gemmatimonadaceae bacterium]|nr:hypothetical protein [Gemmatimonadaceae bacterium]
MRIPSTLPTALAAAFAATALIAGCGSEPVEDPPAAEAPAADAYDPGRFDERPAGVVRAYLQAQDALAHDRFEEAAAALTALAVHATDDLRPLAESAAQAADLAGARLAFRDLSAKLIESPLPEGLGVAFCPMAFDNEGGRWIQAEGEIMNPYYGAAMLRCGVFEGPDESG